VLPTRKVSIGHSSSPVDGVLDVQPGQDIVLSFNDFSPSALQSVTVLVANESSLNGFLRVSFGKASLVVQVSDFDM